MSKSIPNSKCETTSPDRETALRLAWGRGLLSFKLRPYQRPLYLALRAAISNPQVLKFVLNCSRRFGKSTTLCLIALEEAIRNVNHQIRFAAPTQKALRKIIRPIVRMLLEDCPEDLKPNYNVQDNVYLFPNGSEIHMAGTDGGNAENLRGTASNLNIIDEAGFCDDLHYVVTSILMPQTLTTGGTTLLASTPPVSPAHPFFDIAMECKASGNYAEFTINDNTSIDLKTRDLYATESGGYESSTFKREYLCQFHISTEAAIVPEWREELVLEELPTKSSLRVYFHNYVGMDLGVKDFTAAIFGYYDFPSATLYIEEEYTISGPELTTPRLYKDLQAIEQNLWGDKPPYKRISDNNNLMLIADLASVHDFHFLPTNKESLEAMVNEMRVMIAEGRVKILSKCQKTIDCLRYGVWDKKRKLWARSKALGHFDHLAALMYLIRNLDRHTNPIPRSHAMSSFTHHINTAPDSNQGLASLFKRK